LLLLALFDPGFELGQKCRPVPGLCTALGASDDGTVCDGPPEFDERGAAIGTAENGGMSFLMHTGI
jgi:hypothetical protein